MSWGPCEGEVLPQPENCATPEDEDCDGKAPPCKGALVWAKRFGDGSAQNPHGVAVDGTGNVLLAGDFTGSVDFGAGALQSAGGTDVFVAALSPDGDHRWSRRFGDPSSQTAMHIAIDAQGNALVSGYFTGTIDFGGGALQSAGGLDVFVTKLDPDGNHVWSKRFGDAGDQNARGIAVDSEGNVLITGAFSGAVDFGGGALQSAGGFDVFVAKLDSNGGHVWSRRFGDAGDQDAKSIAVDTSGNALITGTFLSSIDFGGGALQSAGGLDVFVAKLDPSGAYLWGKAFGDASDQVGWTVATGSDGAVLVAGDLSGAADFGGGPRQSAGGTDIFLAKFDSAGAHVWSKSFGDASDQHATSVAVDGLSAVVLTGTLDGAADFGGGPIQSAGSGDVFLAKLDPSGVHVWSKRFGDTKDQHGVGVATDVSGNVLLTGYFSGSVDFGGGALSSAGSSDIFVAKFGP
jgi:hypothetical protein